MRFTLGTKLPRHRLQPLYVENSGRTLHGSGSLLSPVLTQATGDCLMWRPLALALPAKVSRSGTHRLGRVRDAVPVGQCIPGRRRHGPRPYTTALT